MAGNKPKSLDHLGPRRGNVGPAGGPSGARAGAPGGGGAAPGASAAKPAPAPPRAPLGPPQPGEYLLHPTAPLVFGTGRPLDFGLGGETLAFPYPATVAGALRAAVQAARGRAPDPFAEPDSLQLNWLTLARLQPGIEPLFPRPADAVHLGGKRSRLQPQPMPADVYLDLPAGLDRLCLDVDAGEGKPDEAPAWWSAGEMEAWLLAPGARQPGPYPGGDRGPIDAPRMHNVIDPLGRGTIEGGLFRSTGLDFAGRSGYALAVSCTALDLDGAARRLGSEGRFARLEASPLLLLRKAPASLAQALAGARRFRCVLVTPAIFEQGGWRPDWIGQQGAGREATLLGDWPADGTAPTVAGLRLVAAAIQRAQSWSGWQPAGQGQPAGPGRAWRVVPAGSVFWFELAEGASVQGGAAALWGRSLCTGHWQRDGWGRCLIGTA
jgi:hypothetical protein